MRILVAEDEQVIMMQYQGILEERGHTVVTTINGLECVNSYREELSSGISSYRPFDLVILDYRMQVLDCMGAPREIIKLCPTQRIVFASAYVAETLREATKDLHQIVELLQNPFGLDYLVKIVEDIEVYRQLASLNVRVRELRNHNLTHSQLVDVLAGARKLQDMIVNPSRART